VFGDYLCDTVGNPAATLAPGVNELLPQALRDLIERFVFTATGPSAPPCRGQQPLGRLVGTDQLYPHVTRR
jgi:hypothetical protein